MKQGHGIEKQVIETVLGTESSSRAYTETYEGQFYQSQRVSMRELLMMIQHGQGMIIREFDDQYFKYQYFGNFNLGKRHGKGLIVETDNKSLKKKYVKVNYDMDELKVRQEISPTNPEELFQQYAPSFYLFDECSSNSEEFTDRLFLPGITIVLDFKNSKNLQSSQVAKYQNGLQWVKLSHFLYDKTLQELGLGEICLFSQATYQNKTRLVDQIGDFNSDLYSLFGALLSKPDILQSIFKHPELDLATGAIALNLYQECLKGGNHHEVIVDFFLPFLAPQGKDLAFIQSVSYLGQYQQFEVWPAMLMKAMAKIHGSYFKLRNLTFDKVAQSVIGCEPEEVQINEQEFFDLMLKAQEENGGIVVVQFKSSSLEVGEIKYFHSKEKKDSKVPIIWSQFNEGYYYPVLETQVMNLKDSQEKRRFYRVVSYICEKSDVKNGLQDEPEVWLTFQDMQYLFQNIKYLPQPGSCFHSSVCKSMTLSPNRTYNTAFFTFKVVRDNTQLKLNFTQEVEFNQQSDGTFEISTLPLQCFIAKQRIRKGDKQIAYEYIQGFGQNKEHIIQMRMTLGPGTYVVMMELEYYPKKGQTNVEARVGMQIQSDHENYVSVLKVDIKELPDYQSFYTECLATLALKNSKKSFFQIKDKILYGHVSKVKTNIWTLQFFSPEHGTYIQIFCNETGLDEGCPSLSWTQQVTFEVLKNMILMQFNTSQLFLPKHYEKQANVKFNIDTPPGGNYRYLIIRQIRGEQYELKGGKSDVSLAEVEDLGITKSQEQ